MTVAVAALLALSGVTSKPKVKSDAIRKWIDGPVRYVASEEEIAEFKHLESDEARAQFIERFWRRRDPDPSTAANENRQLFWDRVRDANAKFTDTPGPGWLTDRGKIYILHGAPSEIHEDLEWQTSDDPSAGRGLIRWTYEGRPEGRMDLDPTVVVPFYRSSSGEWRIAYDPKLSSVFFDWLKRPGEGSPLQGLLDSIASVNSSQLGAMLDLGRMQDIPAQDEYVLTQVETTESFQTRPVSVRIDRYASEAEDGAVVVVTLPVSPRREGTVFSAVARFTPQDPTKSPRTLGERSFRVDSFDGVLVAQGRLRLDPGEYSVDVAVLDPGFSATGLARFPIRVEPRSNRLRLSDAGLTLRLEPVQYRSLISYDAAFVVGGFTVVPRVDARLARGETIQLFFEIYGGTVPYRVRYQLEGREADGRFVPLGPPKALESSDAQQGWSYPTSAKWPLGEYRVRVHVEDASGALAEADVPFTLTAESP